MPSAWADAFDIGDRNIAAPADPDAGADARAGEPTGMFRRLRESLGKSRKALSAELQSSFVDTLDEEAFERLEEALIMADVGPQATAEVIAQLELDVDAGGLDGEAARERLVELLAERARPGTRTIDVTRRPAVLMVVGVNGTGKTTTIGKLAWHLQRELGLNVLLAAGDTYRAAAVEQLAEWAKRAGCEIVRAEEGGDAAAVVYDALDAAEARGSDVVIVDTAGRLHTRGDLMDELAKVNRVAAKRAEGAPHETLLVVDATTGQNGLRQARVFSDAVDVDGVVLTKLDGTARGGIALAIAGELGIPVKLIGVGEALEDLRPFDPEEFAGALLGR
ncbi:MAG: signal recognition particle-docking protein FtsY [Solirubrobacterales bacterium]